MYTGQAPPDALAVFRAADVATQERMLLTGTDHEGKYLTWEKARRHRPLPEGLTAEQWWAGMWLSRQIIAKPLSATDTYGNPFRFSYTDSIQKAVHQIDQQFGDHILVDENRAGEGLGAYRVAALVEEAITSSQLEGAVTTRTVAKEMLRTGRKPYDRSEQMILNNYQAMQSVMELAKTSKPLTIDGICSLQTILTEGTLEDENDAGRIQGPNDVRVAVYRIRDDQLMHKPPVASKLPIYLESLCKFANGISKPDAPFMHPLIRAIILHFWLAYIHPFVDGNGRTARALFYWSLIRSGYKLAPYTSISSILREAPAQYSDSYIHVYSDNNDLTYFVMYQLGVLTRSIQALDDYISRKKVEMTNLNVILSDCRSILNHRQQDIVIQASRNPNSSITIIAHARRHQVSRQSARTDLIGLVEFGLLAESRSGRELLFSPEKDMLERISRLV